MRTGLPYKIEEMEQIQANGAEIDMSDINFPVEGEKTRITFIYLRNTDFNNITFDFSNTSYEDKKDFLISYMTGDITYKIQELIDTWQVIVCNYKNFNYNIKSILTNEEIQKFIEENISLVEEVVRFLESLLIAVISRLEFEDGSIKMDVEEIEDVSFNKNIYNLITKDFIFAISMFEPSFKPAMYKSHFYMENDELFDILTKETPYVSLFYGMTTEDWPKFTDMIVDMYNNPELDSEESI